MKLVSNRQQLVLDELVHLNPKSLCSFSQVVKHSSTLKHCTSMLASLVSYLSLEVTIGDQLKKIQRKLLSPFNTNRFFSLCL